MSNNHLIIGLGGTGGRIIREFRKTVFQEHRNIEPCAWDEKTKTWLPPVARLGYLYVDSNGADLEGNNDAWKVLGHSVKLPPESLLQISDADVQSVFSNSVRSPGIAPWIGDAAVLGKMIGNSGGAQGANQIRRFGRFLFATKISTYMSSVNKAVQKLITGGTSQVTFHVCCTLAAGTGSGCLVDAITQIRKAYPDKQQYRLLIYALVTEKEVPANVGNFYANQYAALTEINALRLGNFRPHDLAGVIPSRLDGVRDNYQQCYLISDENEHHGTATREQQEQIVADFLYQKIVALQGNIPDQINKAESFEDLAMYPHENGERSYFFGTFGVKRLAIPEVEIREKLAFSFAQQACLQFQFNNWSDNGYLRIARNRDLRELVTRAANNERWSITRDHFKLSTDFRLSGGVAWPRIEEDWETSIENEKTDIMETNAKSKEKWLPSLHNYAKQKYDSGFRERGVVQYYEDKEQAKADYAREIRGKVEADLFNRWKTGEDSINDSDRILKELLEHLKAEKKKVHDAIAIVHKAETDSADLMDDNEVQWAKIGWITDAMTNKSGKVYSAYAISLRDYYVARTDAVALSFAEELIQQVVVELTELANQIERCMERVSKGIKSFDDAISARCAREEKVDYQKRLVRLIEPEIIERTIQRLATDRKTQEGQAQAARERICAELGADQGFTSFAKRITEGQFRDALSEACDIAASTAHENLFKESTSDFRRIMGVNIIEKLNEQYGGMTDELEINIRTLMKSAAAYMTFDLGPNNPQPAVLLRDAQMPPMPQGSITVFLPRCPALDQTFRSALKKALQSALSGGQTVQVVDCDHNPHEITIVSTRHWFALRFMKPLATLRDKYQAKIRGDESLAVHQIHLENHRSEVDGVPLGRGFTILPSLFTLDDDATRRKALPILLLAKSMNMISTIKNPDTGLEGLYFVAERNAAGRALTAPIDLNVMTITELGDKITADLFETIESKVRQRLLSDELRHIDKKSEINSSLDAFLDDIYSERKQNDLDAVYKRFLAATDEAKKLVSNPH